jgi:ADP-ribosylarginine hydrolase
MISYKKKVEGSILIASLLETISFNNGNWEFNYGKKLETLETALSMNFLIYNHYMMLGGIENLNMKKFKSSDDTILILATAEAVVNGGGEENYIKSYLKYYEDLKDSDRLSGNTTLKSLEILRLNKKLSAIVYDKNSGGNGCAIRTAPIGLKYYNDIDKLTMEALIASLATHNYPLGYMGGIITAIFTSFAVKNINPFQWIDILLKMNSEQFFINLVKKYYMSKDGIPSNFSDIYSDINEYFIFWKKYKENRVDKMKYRNLPIFITYSSKIIDLCNYSNVNYNKIKSWGQLGGSGLEAVIIAYDNLLLSVIPDKNMNVDTESKIVSFDWKVFIHNNIFFFGDNDSISAISGSWYGAYCGIDKFPIEQIKTLEFYKDLKEVIDKF